MVLPFKFESSMFHRQLLTSMTTLAAIVTPAHLIPVKADVLEACLILGVMLG